LAGQELQVTTLRQRPDLDLSDHLPAEIAVVDPTGAISCTKRKWEETARIAGLRNPARIVPLVVLDLASPDQCREVGADEHALGIVRRGLAIGVVGFGDGVLDVVGAVATEVADFTFR
jgi:hypothetical protein